MKRLLLAALMVMGTTAAATLVAPVPAHAADPGTRLVCDNSSAHPYTGTYKSVTVPKGASCFLRNAVVTGNVKALHGAKNVFIVNTRVDRNIMLRGVTRNVKIGPGNCKIDPIAGNNIKVTRSHNVLICLMSVDNNIMVTRNDGRITLTANKVDNNISVTNNLAYHHLASDGHHKRIAAIRVRHNVAGRHIRVTGNDSRPLILRHNTPTATS
ncbi:hypothetical protein [Nocardioides sp. MH1]|uniref:hypothetical protein n=1 Tax=Nocardioides sp. MH1 TaxID=3242490 RepID=UPI00352197D2